MTVDVLQIVKDVLYGWNIYMPGEAIKSADSDYVLGQINATLDDWNAQRSAVWSQVFTPRVTVPGLQPHLLGPTGTVGWIVPQRPVSVDGARWVIGVGLYAPIFVSMDPNWWAQRSTWTGAAPSGLYYSADEPNGKVYFVGQPTGSVTIELQTRTLIAGVALIDTIDLPQGYRSALTLTVMEAIAEAFGKEVSAKLEKAAGKSRARIFSNNLVVPSLTTRQAGMPSDNMPRRWDYRTGTWF